MYIFYVNVISYLFILRIIKAQDQLFKVGCFSTKDVSDFTSVNVLIKDLSATSCIAACQRESKRFAGVLNAAVCMCGEYYPSTDTDLCNLPCPKNKNESCGGQNHLTVYETARGALGAPQSLIVIESTNSSIKVQWQPPAASLSELKGYKIKVNPLFYFNERFHPPDKKFWYSPLIETAILEGLLPGVKYNIAVQASSKKGDGYAISIDAWTKVGMPETPVIPELISRTSDSMVVKLTEAIPVWGPITYYHVVVVDETLPVVIDHDSLYDYHTAAKQSLPYYITAELTPDTFDTIFTVGNGKHYGKYYNSPLMRNKDYHILLGIISTINETKSSYSESDHSQHESSHFDRFGNRLHHHHHHEDDEEETGSGMVAGLSITIGVLTFLLFSSIIVYFALRVYFKTNARGFTDNQELAVHAQSPNHDENGYVIGSHFVDDEDPPVDYYRVLREKVTIFPHQTINIVGEIGVGDFGEIKKGVSVTNGMDQRNCLIHRIEDSSLSFSDKSSMLKTFDCHIRIGKHKHIVSLSGLLEEFNMISVVFEYEVASLKSSLVDGRALQNYPVYAEKNRRFSTVQENQLLEIFCGIANGMQFLHSLDVVHGQLCCRNVVLKDGVHPKITGFGLLHYHNDVYIPNYCRWQSPEAIRSKVSTAKGDVWSFGCLIWEAVTLGGTPFSDVRSEELSPRVTRGLRLPQPQYISDELYQNMLMCWQNDPDERPTFADIEGVLRRIATDEVTPHVLFSLYPSFAYEPYNPALEFLEE